MYINHLCIITLAGHKRQYRVFKAFTWHRCILWFGVVLFWLAVYICRLSHLWKQLHCDWCVYCLTLESTRCAVLWLWRTVVVSWKLL